MARKYLTKKTKPSRRHRRHRRRALLTKKGGGYGFGGSVLSDVGGPNAGSARWDSDTSKDCSTGNRGGNNTLAGGRRRRNKDKRTRRHRGGMIALQQPRTGYTFNGSGVAGTADTVPVGSPVTVV